MNFLSTRFLATGLAMDAFAVSITGGILLTTTNFYYAFRISVFFAVFQMIMPYLGWYLGRNLSKYISIYGKWIAFLLLFVIGSKMMYDSFHDNSNKNTLLNFNSVAVLLLLSIATSIDAFIAGIGLSFLDCNMRLIILNIGVITFLFSFAGVLIGKSVGYLVKKYAEKIGGLILILIGIQILIK